MACRGEGVLSCVPVFFAETPDALDRVRRAVGEAEDASEADIFAVLADRVAELLESGGRDFARGLSEADETFLREIVRASVDFRNRPGNFLVSADAVVALFPALGLAKAQTWEQQPALLIPITKLALQGIISAKLALVLANADHKYLGEVAALPAGARLKIPGLGRSHAAELNSVLQCYALDAPTLCRDDVAIDRTALRRAADAHQTLHTAPSLYP